jgi:hypothetical protein
MPIAFKKHFSLFLILTWLLAIDSACKKEDDILPTERAENALLIPAVPTDADALLLAIRTTSAPLLPGLPNTTADLVNARFGREEPYSGVGELRVNSTLLRRLSNDIYINGDLIIDYKLLEGTRPRWVAEGGDGFDAFNIQTNKPMPGAVKLKDVPITIQLSDGLSLITENVPANAEAYIWQLGDAKGTTVRKVTSDNSVSFAGIELAGLVASTSCIIQVAAYNSEIITNAGKRFYFVNQTTDNLYVEFR